MRLLLRIPKKMQNVTKNKNKNGTSNFLNKLGGVYESIFKKKTCLISYTLEYYEMKNDCKRYEFPARPIKA